MSQQSSRSQLGFQGPAANALLARGAMGRQRPTTFDLPEEDHKYGKAYPGD